MEAQSDFKKLLELFNAHAVESIIVGAYALSFHGVPRYTADLDILVHPTDENAQAVIAALEQFGFGNSALSPSDFSQPDKIVQLGYPPVRVDIMTSIPGVSWEDASKGSVPGDYGVFRFDTSDGKS